jgi:TolB-like protein
MPYRIAGIDVHKKMLAVVVADVEIDGDFHFDRQKVGTTPTDLRGLADWLVEQDVEEVVMESTAQYWRPVWEALEQHWRPRRRARDGAPRLAGTLHLAQAQSNRGPGGRKKDFPDAELFAAVLKEPVKPWPRGVPVAMRAVVDRCLDKEPARRYPHARDVLRALEGIQSGLTPVLDRWRYRLKRRRWVAAAMAVAAVLGASAAVRNFRNSLGRSTPIRLAVLPFENLTGDPAQAYFSDGLTEETITALGRLHPDRLSVIARTSSMRYKNRDTPLAQIGRELAVDYVLEGSARREGARVRVSTTLVDVRDGTQRWAESFERELSSILTLQSDVARGVAGSLALTLLPAEQSRLAGVRTVNPEAYEAYLRGLNLETNPSPANLNAALRYFELALEKDPASAPAYTGVAGVWFGRLVTSLATKSEVGPAARAAIDKALALDDTLADAHFRRAEYETLIAWDWGAADREFRRAIELNPNQAATRSLYADYLAVVRRPDEALAQAARAMALDPVSTQSQTFYARILMFTRRYDEAIARYRETLRSTPDQRVALTNIRVVLHAARRYEEALAADLAWAAVNTTTGGQDIATALSRGYAEGGYRGAMRRAADVEAARALTNPAIGTFAAQFYVRAGDTAAALDWLEKTFDTSEAAAPYLSCAPIWDDLRGEPRFHALLRKIHLPG